jgi:ATP-dependent DNA helicase RecG
MRAAFTERRKSNAVINAALESSITGIRVTKAYTNAEKEMEKFDLPEPVFEDFRGQFSVLFYNDGNGAAKKNDIDEAANDLIDFCRIPRTRREIAEHLGLSSLSYAIQTHVMPLVEAGLIKLSIPDKPRSHKQTYFSEE